MTPPPNGQDQLSPGRLKLGYWVATHRKQIRIAYTSAVGVVAAVMVGLALFQLIDWLTHIRQTREIYQNFATPLENYSAIRRPDDVVVSKATAVRRDEQSIDIVVELKNPNAIWGAKTFEYEVLYGGASAGTEVVTLAPLQDRFVTRMNIPFAGDSVPSVSVEVMNVEWMKIADIETLPVDNWEFLEPSFRYIETVSGDAVFKTELTFTLRNKSVYGFREPQVVVLMVDAENQPQAVGSLIVDQIESLESRELVFRWPAHLSRGLTPVIHMNVDKLTEERIIRSL